MAYTIRVPRGVVCGITSFNSPLNMVAHKVAPALASGNTVVIKPPQATPLSAALLVQVLLDAGLPPGHVNLVQGPGAEIGGWLVANKTIAFYTFTGSTEVGKQLQQSVGLRPVALELGSIAATIVCEDADLERAATRCANSAFRRAGQACTSVQRLFVDAKIVGEFLERFVAATRRLHGRGSARSEDDRRSDDQRSGGAAGPGFGSKPPFNRAPASSKAGGGRRVLCIRPY